ncbi:hypothetical protein BN2475_250135 [Paraburkholderia ribeironis]|uniref:Uncharacterized protein n=1 Tax=Paraburkholderia ribeironis TaxID=1247936 RepID=A0A1N7RZ08_9BURK|nr:hypothetical protein BN2475_250135 [Paraburkholderia ribeironis]
MWLNDSAIRREGNARFLLIIEEIEKWKLVSSNGSTMLRALASSLRTRVVTICLRTFRRFESKVSSR